MSDGFEGVASQAFPITQRGKSSFRVVESGFGIIDTFDISPEKACEFDVTTGCPELGVIDVNNCSLEPQLGFRHLGGNCSLPDHGIQGCLATGQPMFFCCLHFRPCRTDCFVCFLSVFRLGRVLAWFRAEILIAVAIFHARPGCVDGFL